MSLYQQFKLNLVDFFGLSKDGFHIILGFVIFLGFAGLLKIKLSSWKALIAPLVFAIILEVLDIRDALLFNEGIDVSGAIIDATITISLPLVLIVYLKFKKGSNIV